MSCRVAKAPATTTRTMAIRWARFMPSVPRRENGFDGKREERRDLEGQRQAGIVLARLDRVHRLPGHVEPFAEIGLRPSQRGTKLANSVFHAAPPWVDCKQARRGVKRRATASRTFVCSWRHVKHA